MKAEAPDGKTWRRVVPGVPILLRRLSSSGSSKALCYMSPAMRRITEPGGAMKLLVTGGAGYIGSIVATPAARRRPRGHRARQPRAGPPRGCPGGREFVLADLRDREAVDDALADGFDGVLHFAALALVSRVGQPSRSATTASTSAGRSTCSRRWSPRGVPRLVFSSTCAVYGQPDEVPIPETATPRPTMPTARRSSPST